MEKSVLVYSPLHSKVYRVNDVSQDLAEGEGIMIKLDDEMEEYARVVKSGVPDSSVDFLRIATKSDMARAKIAQDDGEKSLLTAMEIAVESLPAMKFVRGWHSFDDTVVYFLFTSDERLDFRELARKLGMKLQRKVHFYQIGARDKARIIGGLGICGRELCCGKWIKELATVNLESAKVQGIAYWGEYKLSGCCGRLKCCLNFESDLYRELSRKMPKVGSMVKFDDGQVQAEGKLVSLDILNARLRVLIGDQNERRKHVATVKLEDMIK